MFENKFIKYVKNVGYNGAYTQCLLSSVGFLEKNPHKDHQSYLGVGRGVLIGIFTRTKLLFSKQKVKSSFGMYDHRQKFPCYKMLRNYSIPLPEWFISGYGCKLTRIDLLENLASYIVVLLTGPIVHFVNKV